jgi:hypothetical protein
MHVRGVLSPQSPLRPPCLHLWMTPSGALHDLRLWPPFAVPLLPKPEPISRLTDSPTCPLLVAPGPSRPSPPPEGQVSAVSAWVNVLPRAKPSGHTPAGNGTADHTPHIPSPDEGRRAKASRKTEDPVLLINAKRTIGSPLVRPPEEGKKISNPWETNLPRAQPRPGQPPDLEIRSHPPARRTAS